MSTLTASRPASRLLDALCHEVATQNRSAVRRTLSAARRMRLLAGDPAVRYRLDGTELLLPLSHDLPVHRARIPGYSQNLAEVAGAVSRTRGTTTVIDIGANVGDSVAIISAAGPARILCIEGDPHFLPYLEHNVGRSEAVEIEPNYVASADVDLSTRSADRAAGTARLVESSGRSGAGVRALGDILAAHPRFARPTLLTIDTDGHDGGIIRAAASILSTTRPVLFFEYDPTLTRGVGAPDLDGLFASLVEWGYGSFVLYANSGEEVGRFTPSDIPDLEAMAGALRPGAPVPYWDVLAVPRDDVDLLTHLPEPSRLG